VEASGGEAAGARKKMKVVVADAGYWSEENVRAVSPWGPRLLIGTENEQRQHDAIRGCSSPPGEDPHGCDGQGEALLTKPGKQLYGLRSTTVEPAIGQIKEGRGCDRLLRRGAVAAWSE